MSKYDKKASRLKNSTVADEEDIGGVYDDEQVKRSVVHTRQDVILIVSYLSSLNIQLQAIKWLLLGLLIILFFNLI
jgi:hypothetical protein